MEGYTVHERGGVCRKLSKDNCNLTNDIKNDDKNNSNHSSNQPVIDPPFECSI
jgi:hypothetical protein